MVIEIRRWHILIAVCAGLILARAAIFSKESRPSLQDEAKPAASVVKIPEPLSVAPSLPTPATLKEATPAAPASPLKTLAFTFDDGPHPGHTERLLQVLRAAKVRATFFVVGRQVELFPEILKLIAKDGHEIGNHTYSHPDMRTLEPAAIAEELAKTEKLVFAVTGRKMKYFRPPGGRYNPSVVAAAKTQGYEMVLWSVLPEDHARPPASVIRSRVLSTAKGGGIVLMHSGVENTLESLPGIIAALRDRGYKFKTVSQMRSDPHPKITRAQ
ncbi:MAG: hypothetical protein A2901_03955 [Elusimicrobia bacterium RIFCSPLOWO2_01_FULL_54_10]|nr:MAG: hypothetical protein A2901_03955 [Elusimicrobia bacterium RIFCSPLOWO2_01_FULL_54_10]